MLISFLFLTTFFVSYVYYKRTNGFPSLEFVILVSVALSAIIQSLRFIMLVSSPDLSRTFIWSMVNNFGFLTFSDELIQCLSGVGNEFDRFSLAIGPVAVIWISVKGIVQLLPNRPRKGQKASSGQRQSSGN